jgi:hypothetical protein
LRQELPFRLPESGPKRVDSPTRERIRQPLDMQR